MKVLVFGGTSEGRELVEWLSAQGGFEVAVCTATEYGAELVGGLAGVEVHEGRLDTREMEQLMAQGSFDAVVDATHPYAAVVTQSIAEAAAAESVPYYRLVRDAEPSGEWRSVADAAEAARVLAATTGNILLTTGSKDLSSFVRGIPDYQERLYVRVLPAAESLLIAHELDIPLDHIIAMQGPFSEELNCALIHEFAIRTLVTKASGVRGGFWEKVAAAQACGTELLVISRPVQEEGYSLEELEALLAGSL